jgi:hypothetical protein
MAIRLAGALYNAGMKPNAAADSLAAPTSMMQRLDFPYENRSGI